VSSNKLGGPVPLAGAVDPRREPHGPRQGFCRRLIADMFAFESEVTARIARAIDLELVDVGSRWSRDRAGSLDRSFHL